MKNWKTTSSSYGKIIHKKDEVQHKIWNDMQEKIYQLCIDNSERLTVVESRLGRLETDVSAMKQDIIDLKSDVVTLKSDMAEVKGILRQLLQNQVNA